MIKTKRVLSLLFALAMLVSVLGSGALAANYEPVSIAEGEPVNPYTYNTTGGNAYDISWAVDDNGEPVRLSTISKIRVYTSAALNVSSADAPIFTVPAIFGETSAEVCGIYAVTGSGSGEAVAPTFTIDGMSITELENDWGVNVVTTSVSDNQQIIEISGLGDVCGSEYELNVSGGTYIYINGVSSTTSTIPLTTNATMVQVINQSGTAEPFVALLKLSA